MRPKMKRRVPLTTNGAIELVALEIRLLKVKWDAAGLRMVIQMPDRDTGAALTSTYEATFSERADNDTDMAALIVKSVANLLAHEVAENILVQGERVLDPHVRRELFFK